MEIERYHRKVSLIASAGNVIPRATDSSGELGRLGAVVTQFGLAIEQDRLKAEEYDQLTSAENQVNREYDELFNSLDPNDTDSWLEIIRKKSFDKTTELVTNTQAQAKWGPRLEAKRIQFERHVLSEKGVVDTRNYRQNYFLSFKNSIERAAKQESPGEFRQVLLGDIEVLQGLRLNEEGTKQLIAGTLEITPENFESLFESVDDYDNPLFKDYELRINEAKVLVKAASEDKKKKFMEDQLAIALSLPDDLGYIDKINTDDWPFNLDDNDISDLKSKYQAAKKIREYENKAQREKREAEVELKARGFAIDTPERPADWQAGVDIINASLPELGSDWHSQAINKHQNAFRIMNATGKNVYKETQSPAKFGEIRDRVIAGTVTEKEIRANVGPDGYSTTDEAYLMRLFNGDESNAKALEDSAAGQTLTELIKGVPEGEARYDSEGLLLSAVTKNVKTFAEKIGLRWLEDAIRNNPEWTTRQKDEEAIRIFNRVNRMIQAGEIEIKAEQLPGAKQKEIGLFPSDGGGIFRGHGASGGWIETGKEPTQNEFTQNIAALKRQGKTKEAREYYDKWVGKLWQ